MAAKLDASRQWKVGERIEAIFCRCDTSAIGANLNPGVALTPFENHLPLYGERIGNGFFDDDLAIALGGLNPARLWVGQDDMREIEWTGTCYQRLEGDAGERATAADARFVALKANRVFDGAVIVVGAVANGRIRHEEGAIFDLHTGEL